MATTEKLRQRTHFAVRRRAQATARKTTSPQPGRLAREISHPTGRWVLLTHLDGLIDVRDDPTTKGKT